MQIKPYLYGVELPVAEGFTAKRFCQLGMQLCLASGPIGLPSSQFNMP
jgi:hypothetical protein